MGHPTKRRKGKRRWSKIGFLIFYVLFLAIAIGRKNIVNADSDEITSEPTSVTSNLTVKIFNNTYTGEYKQIKINCLLLL